MKKTPEAETSEGNAPRDYLTPELKLIKDLDSLVNRIHPGATLIATRGVRRAILAAREHGFHNLADKAIKLARI